MSATKLSKAEIDMAVDKSIASLDPSNMSGAASSIRPYYDLIGVQRIPGTRLSFRIVRKVTAAFAMLFKKTFQDYLEQRTRVDTLVYDEMQRQAQNRDALAANLMDKLDQKNYENQLLIDKFKKEILFELVELKHGGASDTKELKTKILSADRVAKLDKVNIGSGTDIREDYINVDHRALEGVDVVADVLKLPFKENTLKEIFASHVVEHFIEKDMIKIYRYWFSLLRKGGALRIIVPNIEDMAKRYANGEVTWSQLRAVALGGQDYASDYHFNHFSVETMRDLVLRSVPEATFEVVSPSRRNGECFEMEVLIKK